MSSVNYSYVLSEVCASGVNIDTLSFEIRESAITKNLHYIFVDEDAGILDIWFRDELTQNDVTLLMSILNSHQGLPLVKTYSNYYKSTLIDDKGNSIGVSDMSPFHVVTSAEAHAVAGPAHYGILEDNQIPDTIARYNTLSSGYLNDLYYIKSEVDENFKHLSAGLVSIPEFEDLGNGSITVSGCYVNLFTQPFFNSKIERFYVFPATLMLTNLAVNYIVVDYNNGNPVYRVTLDTNEIDECLVIPVYTIARHGDHIHLLFWNNLGKGLSNKLHARLVRTSRFSRELGLDISVSGSANLVISSGIVWYGAVRVFLPEFNSAVHNLEFFYHHDGEIKETRWVRSLGNSHYDDGYNLIEIDEGHYTNCWIYRYISNINNEAAFVFGRNSYASLNEAESENAPSGDELPSYISKHCLLIGRITFQKSHTVPSAVVSAFTVVFPGASLPTHNSLGDLQGGFVGEYFHLNYGHYQNLTGGSPSFISVSGIHYGNGSHLTDISHSNLLNLNNDDHQQYFNISRGDERYYTQLEVDSISGSIVSKIIVNHANLLGLYNDDHPQYYTEERADLKYSQLGHAHNDIYYIKSEIDLISGTINSQITDLNLNLSSQIHTTSGSLQSQINNLDSIYATDEQVSTLSGAIVSQIITDHGILSGLEGDDHQQYLLANGSRNLSNDWHYGSFSLSGTGEIIAGDFIGQYVDLANVSDPTYKEGRLFWDTADHTLSFYNEQPGEPVKVGQELFVRVYNNKTFAVPKGSVVFIDGSYNGNPTVDLSLASMLNVQDLGVCCGVIQPNSFGYIKTFGFIGNIDTSMFQPGDRLYTSPIISGALTNLIPTAPNRVSEIGWVIKKNSEEGVILVDTKHAISLQTLSDVDLDGINDGDLLSYDKPSKTWKNILRNSHNHESSQVLFDVKSYILSDGDLQNNVDSALKEYFNRIYTIGGTGRTAPEVSVILSSPFELTVYSGSGYIFKEEKMWEVTWSGSVINTYGYSEGYYWIYVDVDNQVAVTNVEPDFLNVIVLASFYTTGPGVISVFNLSSTWYDNVLSRIVSYMRHLGSFIYDGGGNVLPRSEDTFTIRSTACKVQHLFREVQLTEVSSLDFSSGRFTTWANTSAGWVSDYYMLLSDGGRIPVDRYNNVTGSGVVILPYDCTLVSGSNIVTSSGNLTIYLSYGDLIYKESDGIFASALVSGVSWDGNQSTVVLFKPYVGSGGTGRTKYIDALEKIPNNKWVKHLVVRTLDDRMHFVYSQGYYDSEQLALDGGLPELPVFLRIRALNVACIVVSTDTTSLENKIHDIRPLPFYDREGGKQTGGAVISHSDLTGLSADDHIQYLNESRGDARYYTKVLLNAGQLDSRYYTENEINNINAAISGSLQNQIDTKSPVDHIHDNRYYTETELDSGQLNSLYYTKTQLNTGQLDNRYYTRSQVDTISGALNDKIISVSGALQISIDTKSDTNHLHDDRYYNKIVLDNGQLDSRYFTEDEVTTISGHIVSQLHQKQHSITSVDDHIANPSSLFYSDASGVLKEIPLASSGTILTSTGYDSAPLFKTLSSLLDTYTDLPVLHVYRQLTTTVPTSYIDIIWTTVNINNYPDVINWIYGPEIIVKETGLYLIAYAFPDNNLAGHTINLKVVKNSNTDIVCSFITFSDSGSEDSLNIVFPAFLNANDRLKLQVRSSPQAIYAQGINFFVVRLRGIKGDIGPAGSGSTVHIQNKDVTISGSPFSILNFKNGTISGTSVSGVVDIDLGVLPGGLPNSVQFNNAGSFGGDSGFVYNSTSGKVTISGAAQTTRLVLGGEDDNNNAALYIQVDGDSQSEGMRTHFRRAGTGYNGWIVYHYDGNTPNIRLIDQDDDPPYIAFQTIWAGTYANPQIDNRFGTRGSAAGATTGFQWIVNGATISEMDTQWFRVPGGTTAQRPTPVAGMTRWNSTILGMEYYDGRAWQPQVFGNYFVEASSEEDSSTTSTNWISKVTLIASDLPVGKYRIGWHYNLRGSSTNSSPRGRVVVNNTDVVHHYLYEPKDASTNEEDTISGFYYYTIIESGGSVNVVLEYSSEVSGATTTIRRARLEFWRVS